MNTIILAFGAAIAVLLVGAIVVVLMATTSRSQKKRMEDLHARHIARQPWDAAGGRGNR